MVLGELLLSLLVALPSVLSAPPPAPATQAACEAAGGTWGRFGLLARELCDLPTGDAGKPCSDHADCESVCVATGGAQAGDRVTGRCFARRVTLGTCLPYVANGVAQGVICVD